MKGPRRLFVFVDSFVVVVVVSTGGVAFFVSGIEKKQMEIAVTWKELVWMGNHWTT